MQLLLINQLKEEAAIEQGTYTQEFRSSIWFLRNGIVIFLKMTHKHRNMLQKLI